MAHRRPRKSNPKARVTEKKGKSRCEVCGKLLSRSSLSRHYKIHDRDEHKPKARRVLKGKR